MMQFPIIPPVAPPPRRDCIVVDQHVYCRESATTPRELGFLLLFLVIFLLWGLGGPVIDTLVDERFYEYRRFKWPTIAAWYLVPVSIVIVLLIW